MDSPQRSTAAVPPKGEEHKTFDFRIRSRRLATVSPWFTSTLRRGLSRSGKNLPIRSAGIWTLTSPAGGEIILARAPRQAGRSCLPRSLCSASCTSVDT